MVGWKQKSSWFIVTYAYVSAFSVSSSFAWRWRTNDAIVQDVWPENDSIKFKRASADSSAIIGTPKVKDDTPPVDLDEEESMLVFDGRYFKPNEVPPPPPFMVADSNWLGGSGIIQSATIKQDKDQQKPKISGGDSSTFQFVVGTSSKSPPSRQKNMVENADYKNETTEERISSSNSKNIITSSPIEFIEDLHFQEENEQGNDHETEEAFHSAPKCFTATDTPGRCVSFRQCYPVVFNVIDGGLRNPGLAKLLYQSSGPCNATLELEFALSKLKNDKTYINAKFYNQSICCPGFKHPPTILRSWEKDLRKTRLTTNATNKTPTLSLRRTPISISSRQSSSTIKNFSTKPSNVNPIYAMTKDDGSLDSSLTLDENKSRPVGIDESSVEISQDEFSDNRDGSEEREDSKNSMHENISILGGEDGYVDDDEIKEEKNIRLAVGAEIVRENSTLSKASNVEDTDHDDDDSFLMEERRGNRDKESNSHSDGKKTTPSDAFLSVSAPNLAPNKCRHQIYGMPRGHWPWMVALVISSRHICSGALIDERHVLTAAHCVHLLSESDVKKLRIIIGDRVMYSAVDGPHFWRKASRITTHANYNQQTFAGDIAVIKMNSDVPFTRNIQPISLSDLVSPVDSSTFGKGIVAGWSGADIGQPAFEARTEQETVVAIMDKEECRELYRGFALSGLATNTFCSVPANNTCVADSGAPLIVRVQNCWVLAGIMSWGLGCSHFPEVYTDVTRYTSWVRKHVV